MSNSNKQLRVTTLCNDNFIVKFSNKGASIASFKLRNNLNEFENIALEIDTDSANSGNEALAGCTVGPCAGRIKSGRLPIISQNENPLKNSGSDTGNACFCLEKNDGNNHIHGGFDNLSNAIWEMNYDSACNNEILYTYQIGDGISGYPGNRNFSVKYELKNNGLAMTFSCISDKDTYVNMTNHTYWNLAGDFSLPISEHKLFIPANHFVENDNEHIPKAISSVSNTLFDFREGALFDMKKYYTDSDSKMSVNENKSPCFDSVSDDKSREQLANARGYNNAFLLSDCSEKTPNNSKLHIAAKLSYRNRTLTITTDYPAVVLYSGGYLGQGTLLSDKSTPHPSCAVALECQECPDAPNFPGVSYSILKAGESFCRHIEYLFD